MPGRARWPAQGPNSSFVHKTGGALRVHQTIGARRMTNAATGIRAHLLPLGDEAGPEPALYALHGVNLSLEPSMRPTGWEDELDFGPVKMAGLRSPLTMWLIEGADL